MKSGTKGCLAAIGVVAVAFVIVIGLIGYWLVTEYPNVEATLVAPSSVTLNEPFALVIEVRNPHGENVTLDSIDIDDGFLNGFQVVSVDPSPSDVMNVPILNQRSWMFERELAPNESMNVTFEMKPVLVGHYSGDVDVCNPSQDYQTLFADIVIQAAEAAVE
jgi:hypothetical protein